jgi:hypothetical protein
MESVATRVTSQLLSVPSHIIEVYKIFLSSESGIRPDKTISMHRIVNIFIWLFVG